MVCNNKTNLPELLAPAGSFEHLKTAIKAGADAVYLGGAKFGARAYAGNFTEEELVEAIHYAHFYQKKVYLTVNTLVKESELSKELYDFLVPYYKAGLDGVIVQDMGVAAYIREHFPKIEIHGSTQMTITTSLGAKAAKRMGMCRVVPARELSLEEIISIKKETGLELEIFIHGALCYCYSGQCLLSSVYGGRSGNRGRCAQPCRLPYRIEEAKAKHSESESLHYLSPKDLCSLHSIPEIVEAGIDSLKIEGRMKNTDYVAGVVMIYRKYLDYYASLKGKKAYKVKQSDLYLLEEIFSRDGFTDGYFHRHNGKAMMSMQSPNHLGRKIGILESIKKNKISIKLTDAIRARDILVLDIRGKNAQEVILTVPNELEGKQAGSRISMNIPASKGLIPGMPVYRRKSMELAALLEEKVYQANLDSPVKARITVKKDGPVTVELSCQDCTVELIGPVPEKASGKPVTVTELEKQFKKTGSVPFYLEKAEITVEDGLFLPLSHTKKLRQDAYRLLEDKMRCRGERSQECIKISSDLQGIQAANLPKSVECGMISPNLVLTVYDLSMLEQVLELSKPYGICLPMDHWQEEDLFKAKEILEEKEIKAYLSLPRMIREEEFQGASKSDLLTYDRIGEILAGWDGYYVHHINEAELICQLKSQQMIERSSDLILSASLYQWNRMAMQENAALFGLQGQSLIMDTPLEYTFEQARSLMDQNIYMKKELLVYGRYPLMISAQCLNKSRGKCSHVPDQFTLVDKKGRKLPVTTHCRACYNLIWKDEVRDFIKEIKEEGLRTDRIRMDFFGCSAKTIKQVLQSR